MERWREEEEEEEEEERANTPRHVQRTDDCMSKFSSTTKGINFIHRFSRFCLLICYECGMRVGFRPNCHGT